MSEGSLTHEDVLEIIKLVQLGDAFTEFKLRYEGVEIEISKNAKPADAGVARTPTVAALAQPVAPAPAPAAALAAPATAPAAASTPASANPAAKSYPEGVVIVKAPMVGTFYRAPEPGAKPFVEVGARVQANDTVCIIEVMKLMNAMSAEAAGVVLDVLVSDGQTVEYGQPLVVIDPSR
jgi:acetyl-CoA carboxylase biotin carboxyl carrier protein